MGVLLYDNDTFEPDGWEKLLIDRHLMKLGVNSKYLLQLAAKHQVKNAELIIDDVKSTVRKCKEFTPIANVSKTTIQSMDKILSKYIKD